MTEQETKKKQLPVLGYIRDRWHLELEPVLAKAALGQEQELESLWERTLRWLKEERGLQGDSLRKPITQIRGLIKTLALSAENTWTDPRSHKQEHVALHVFNLPEQEWERMNARSAISLQERLENQQFLEHPDSVVHRGLILVQSSDWAELLVALALGTGRRFWELVKTGTFVEAAPYVVKFRGQVKGHGREDESFEIVTLYRAFLVVEGIQRLRRLIDWDDLEDEYSPKYQKYNRAANEMVVNQFTDLIPVRPTRDRLNLHVLRAVFARIATYWYCPPEVADITFMAQIQGHRYILEPEVEQGETPEDIKNKRLNYAANANYFDYKIGRRLADGSYQVVGDQGIKLGLPGVTRLSAFPAAVSTDLQGEIESKRKGKGKEQKRESTSDWAPITLRRHSRDWFRDLSGAAKVSGSRQSEKDDAFMRRLLTLYVVSDQAERAEAAASELSLDILEVPEKTRDLFRQAMALSGTTDVLSFILTLAEPEAQRLVNQEVRHNSQYYETLSTDDLFATRDDPGARQELYRRAVYAVMKYNQEHSLRERWYLSDRALQGLAGGRKDFIKLYKEAHAEEIETHHRDLDIQEGFNRKPGNPQIQDIIQLPKNATDFPWGREPVIS
jgi:Spy/CpxP family protein refolding chaperone